MLTKSNKLWPITVAAILTLSLLVFFLSKGASETPKEGTATATVEKTADTASTSDKTEIPSGFSVTAAMKDRVIGNPNAPVTIVEYASMTCSHCAHFATESFHELKTKLIDTGKAKFIFRDFALDNFALKAAMMARCLPEDKYYNMVEVIFSNQARWTSAEDPLKALSQLASLAGMGEEEFKTCTSNKELEDALLKTMQDAQTKYNLRATPSFVFNDGANVMTGAGKITDFEIMVNNLTKGAE